MEFCRARNRNDPWFLREQPRECDLSGACLLTVCYLAKQIDQRLMRFPGFGREAREDVAKIGTVECCAFIHFSREKTSAQRTVWDETDSKFLKRRQHFLLGFSPPQRVFVLHCRHRLNCVCTTDCWHSRFRKTEVLDLPLVNQILHRARHIF